MDNQVITELIKTTLTGTIEGQNVIVDFENKPGLLPKSVNAFCKIVSASSICTIVLNVGAVSVGNKTLTVSGTEPEDMTILIARMESTVEAILING